MSERGGGVERLRQLHVCVSGMGEQDKSSKEEKNAIGFTRGSHDRAKNL